MDTLENLKKSALSRRNFIAGAGTAAAATLAVGCSGGTTPVTITNPTAPTAPTYSDVDILNFALNLEYLEAEFYLRAATGSGLPTADAGGTTAGAVTGGAMVTGLTSAQSEYLNAIAQDEYNHVKFLRAAMTNAGVTPVVRPAIDLTNSFAALGKIATAGFTTPITNFNPFASFNAFLIGAFIFEDVGVTAYHGASGALSKGSAYLTPAAQILAVEAYHAGIIRSLIVGTSAPTASAPNVPGDQTYVNLARAVATVRAALGGGGELLLTSGLGSTTSGSTTTLTVGASTIVNADANSVAFARTFDQVLHIVYASATASSGTAYGLSSGGFFPSGLNGNIKTTYS